MNNGPDNTYLVGGAVRDTLLGLPVRERDWVVVGSTPEALLALGFQPVGKDFPVFLHPQTKEEYALARTERKSGHGYTGFTVHASPEVTLEEDLLRRDLTINAIAQAADGSLIDPHGGQRDLEQKRLRHVSPAFAEDPVRVLRIARFAARFAPLGFRVAEETRQLMQSMVAAGELDHLVPERVWQELWRALSEPAPQAFVQVLRDCGALKTILPELDALFGVPQPAAHHPEIDSGLHVLMALEQAVKLTPDPLVRFAVLLHDLGKGRTKPEDWPRHIAHEQTGLPLVRRVCERLRAPADARELALLTCAQHLNVHRARELRPATLLKLLQNADFFRRPERFEQLLLACEADARGRAGREDTPYPQADYLRAATGVVQGITSEALRDRPDLKGAAFGQALNELRLRALTDWKNRQDHATQDTSA